MGTKSIRVRTLQCLALWMVLFLSPLCFGQMFGHPVVVRVLNGQTGQPLAGQLVTLHLRFGKMAGGVEHNLALIYQTDASGEVRAPMPEIVPANLDVEVTLRANDLHCPHRVVASTSTVMHQGVMVTARLRGASAPGIQAAPGEIVFVARPSRLFEKVMFE